MWYSTAKKRAKTACFRLLLIELGVLILLTGCRSDAVGPGSSGKGGSLRIEGDRAEVEGYIQSLSPSRLVVFNTTVLVNDLTEIRAEHGAHMTFSDLLVGMWVDVRGAFVDGVVVAERIEVEDEAEASGPTTIDSSHL
ncbi:MAG: DUF5666 domain-containing protein [Candidatus Krumholzibacteria bacterium]|nr:DUF5666 domain-containing protein [Candidatus Krumholzibacteria bacterium]